MRFAIRQTLFDLPPEKNNKYNSALGEIIEVENEENILYRYNSKLFAPFFL
ncbi:MAG: hypothetical protein ACI9QN_001814 [Arcticibacterium sp.]|jgi:hypothetical protein